MDRARRNLLIGGSSIGAMAVAGLLPGTCGMQQRRRKPITPENSPPKRPPGSPKPLLEEDITPVLARLDAWYAAHLPPDRYRFNPPASESELDAFERLIGLNLPRSYRQLYRWHNGDENRWWCHLYGFPLLSLHAAADEWRVWNEVLTDFEGNRYEIPGASWPAGAVDPAYINPRWIPLTSDVAGGHIGLDFDPWPAGRIGQVIIYGRDEEVKVVLAESLGKFLEWIAGLLEGGNFTLGTEKPEEVWPQFRLKNPPEIHFHSGARILLGAPDPFLSQGRFTYRLASRRYGG